MIKDLLPIGSVVSFKEVKHLWMIYGIKQTDIETKKEYDYIAVPYPEGNIGTKNQYMINKEIIDKVIFRGYECDLRNKFIEGLTEYFEKVTVEKE